MTESSDRVSADAILHLYTTVASTLDEAVALAAERLDAEASWGPANVVPTALTNAIDAVHLASLPALGMLLPI